MNASINYSSFIDLAKRSAREGELDNDSEMSEKFEKTHSAVQSCSSALDDTEHLFET